MVDGGAPGGGAGRVTLPQAVRRIATGGALLFWITLLGLLLIGGVSPLDSLLLAVLLVAVPALSLAQLPLIDSVPLERLPAYWSSIVTLWLLGGACWLVGTRHEGPSAVGLVPVPLGAAVLWSVGLAGGGLLTILIFRQVGRWIGAAESPVLRRLLPRTRQERSAFALLSVAAGFGEEIAYRGYLIPALAPVLGIPGAAVVSSCVFGVLHGYQGPLGVVRTATMGGMLAWGFLTAGSLWPGVVAHTLIDLAAGLWLGERLLSPEHT